MNAIEIRGVTKSFGETRAVDDLTLSVPAASTYGFIGPNGSGKTTTLRMILNILLPDRGEVAVFGDTSTRASRDRVGYLPEERGLYKQMKLRRLLQYFGRLKNRSGSELDAFIERWLARFDLTAYGDKRIDTLSKGMAQKAQFIAAIVGRPDLLILDEPFSGLDPVNAQVIRDTILDWARTGRTVLFSTHIMEHAEQICDHVCIIARGQKRVDGTLAEVKRLHGGRHLSVAFDGANGGAAQVFADRRLVAKVENFGQYAELELTPTADAQEILKALVASGARLAKFELVAPSLHKIFIDLVGADAARPDARPEVARA